MTDPKTCPTCGAPLPSDATGGACPKCLLQAGLATGGSSPRAGDHVPTPEELAPHFPGLVIEDVLGRGGMGVVYKARHKALDREVALKVLPERVAADRAFADRFQREARALAKLQHPNIVAVHDFGVTDGLFWLVMEYVDGANIRQAMRAGQIGPKEALAIVPQICDALQYAHEHGVVHRDIKPENVLLDKAGHVKVADFGLAKLMEHDAADATLTGAGQVMGTPHYMAPEQWEKPTTVDHRADIYSLGVVFYEMLTGELPVGRFAAPSKKSDVDARIDEIVLRTLEREREARYQQVSQVKTDMGRASVAVPPPAVAAASQPMPAAYARHWQWPIGVTTIAGVLSLLWGLFSTEATATRFWIGGFGLIVCVVQFVDWRIRRAHPDDRDTNKRMAWLVGNAVVSVGMCLILANTLHTAVMRDAAGTLGFVTGAYMLVEMWKLRRGPRTDAPVARKPISVVGWVAIVFLAFVFLGALTTCVFSLTGKLVDQQAALNERVQRDQAAQQAMVDAQRLAPTRDFAVTSDRGERLSISAADREAIVGLWDAAQRLGPTPKLDDALALYSITDAGMIRDLPPDDRKDRASRGALGLPVMDASRLPAPLAGYAIEKVVVHASHGGATVTVVRGASRVHFQLSQQYFPATLDVTTMKEGGPGFGPWKFAVEAVQFE
jgi:tRNA A-37 threonylcarbamoyl transferase component Bud32